jgi:hypothetical protein
MCVHVCVCVCVCERERERERVSELRQASLPYLSTVYLLKTQPNTLHCIFHNIRHTSNKNFRRTVRVYEIFNVT